MSGTRVLWGQVAIVLSIVLTAIWCATEWTAWRLGFQAQLGSPGSRWRAGRSITRRLLLVVVLLRRLCATIFIEGAYHRGVGRLHLDRRRHRHVGASGAQAKNVATYGSARWAEEEIRAAGLLGPDGVCSAATTATISAMTDRSMSVLRTDPIGQGRRSRRADAADLAGQRDHSRHQGRELG
jgi:type IV secretion system protein VirD4